MLKMSEVYGPVSQGEGKNIGKQIMFVRTAICNQHCRFCDTPYTWNWIGTKFEHPQKFDMAKEIHHMTCEQVFAKLVALSPTTKAIVLSGGEPMIQQKRLIPLLQCLKLNGYLIEVETAGTIEPTDEFLSLVDQVNCSPKLANSGNSVQLRLKPNALTKISQSGKANFKFVVSSEADVEEILALVDLFDFKEVYLMPEGRSRSEIVEHQAIVDRLCNQYGFKPTTRLHILEHGNVRGV